MFLWNILKLKLGFAQSYWLDREWPYVHVFRLNLNSTTLINILKCIKTINLTKLFDPRHSPVYSIRHRIWLHLAGVFYLFMGTNNLRDGLFLYDRLFNYWLPWYYSKWVPPNLRLYSDVIYSNIHQAAYKSHANTIHTLWEIMWVTYLMVGHCPGASLGVLALSFLVAGPLGAVVLAVRVVLLKPEYFQNLMFVCVCTCNTCVCQKDHKKENNLNRFSQSQTHSYFGVAKLVFAGGLSTCIFGLDSIYVCLFTCIF